MVLYAYNMFATYSTDCPRPPLTTKLHLKLPLDNLPTLVHLPTTTSWSQCITFPSRDTIFPFYLQRTPWAIGLALLNIVAIP